MIVKGIHKNVCIETSKGKEKSTGTAKSKLNDHNLSIPVNK